MQPATMNRWIMAMRWHDLLFMHWPIAPQLLRPLVPSALELDTFDRQAWLGIVPFRMTGVRPRFVPPLPWLSAFPELNVRTYVTANGKPGVWFFSLDAAQPVAVRLARWTYHLPYFDADMSVSCRSDEIDYRSIRTHRGAAPAALTMRYQPTGGVFHAKPGSLDAFVTDRLCLYAATGSGKLYRGDIWHQPWPLQTAQASIQSNTMTDQLGIRLPDTPPVLHFARRLNVVARRLVPV